MDRFYNIGGSFRNLLKELDLILVGDECSLVDAVATDQQLIVQGKSEISQAKPFFQREIQSLQRGLRKYYTGIILIMHKYLDLILYENTDHIANLAVTNKCCT